jgi:hypothetical protein
MQAFGVYMVYVYFIANYSTVDRDNDYILECKGMAIFRQLFAINIEK